MSDVRHITWENFELHFIAPGVPAKHPLIGQPTVHLFYAVDPRSIGVAVSLQSPLPVPLLDYSEIEVAVRETSDGPALVIFTRNSDLFRPFFSLALEIADAVQVDRREPFEAVLGAIDRFASVIKVKQSVSLEKILGLWGELEVLERMLRNLGPHSLDSWYGCEADTHDFRLGDLEIEVKTTLRARSVHVINGLGQLQRSKDRNLILVSLQLVRTQDGLGLAERVQTIEALLAGDRRRLSNFRNAISSAGFDLSTSALTIEKFALRRDPWLVIVDDEQVPKLTREALANVLTPRSLDRLVDVTYSISVEGLGHLPETDLFRRYLPWWRT